MTVNDLRALIERVRDGDLEALDAAVELAERLALEQELANAPSGIRERALAAHAALWKQQRAKANRSKATAASNKARGEQHQAAIDTVLASMALHDKPKRDLTGIVRNSLKAYKRKLKKKTGLRKVPCQTAVRKRIKSNTSTGVTD
ncbi:hypothetical protein D3C77_260620 [compost metagenome]